MSAIGWLWFALGFASFLLVLALLALRRQRVALQEFSQRVQRVAVGGSLQGRIERRSDHPEIIALTTSVNHLLSRVSAHAAGAATPGAMTPAVNGHSHLSPRPAIGRNGDAPLNVLAERVHEAVLIHGAEGIRYANQHFATLLGAPASDLLGVNLADVVPPEYSELVGDNIQRRLAGEATAERYEVDLVGLQGQAVRLELSSWPIDLHGRPALL